MSNLRRAVWIAVFLAGSVALSARTATSDNRSMDYQISSAVLGNVDNRRTEIEIVVLLPDSQQEYVWATVYDSPEGWRVEFPPLPVRLELRLDDINSELESARETLSHYVNRRGENPPDGLTRAGFSLWLMILDDGTAMGRPIK